METIYQLPTWAETLLVICLAFMLAGLATWLACRAITEAVNSACCLENKRRESETRALDSWHVAYQQEHDEHLNDVAEMSAEVLRLKRDIERMKAIMEKAKVNDL